MGTGTDTHGAVPALSADAYYNQSRADLTALLPLPLGNVLDVGCGAGGVGQHLSRRPGERLVGVEINAEQAALAAAHYDDVVVGSVPEAFDLVEGSFQTVLCYDVLEHLVDPATVLRTLSERLAEPNAVLHVSVPNARHLSLVRDLVFRGTFGYRPYGHRDATHLRWFTRRDIVDLLETTGWRVESVQTPVLKPGYRAAAAASGGFAKEFLTIQWYVLARRAG
jgi:2-polyprenyl-3-methyl-5-hydroxy-6-metoxy-1,4-benzoquinol methylase